MTKWILLISGGALGATARYIFSGLIVQILGARFPFGTLFVNIIGCFLAGIILVVAEEKFLLSANIQMFLLGGFLGAFTTYSTYIIESFNLFKNGEWWLVFINLFGSIILGILFFYFGMICTRAIT